MSDEKKTTPPSSESAWLEQYYTSSKTRESAPEPGDVAFTAAAHIAATDKYTVGEEVGSGGMKSVRRARDQNANRDVAMAMLLEGHFEPRFIRRFVREARLTAALEHPNIVPVHEIGVSPSGQPYFTMKLLGGESLHSVLRKLAAGDPDYRQRYTLSRLLQIFLGAGNAVAFAHSRGVIHLDLKPANIQIGGFGEVLVLDWGLAKIMDRPGALELPEELRVVHAEGVVRGTPGFMAPEQTRGEYSKFDERTDVYALGVVLQTVLTHKLPGTDVGAPFRARPAGVAPGRALLQLSNDRRIPVALQAVVLKAVADDPAARYQSVRDLLRDVQAFLAGYATSAQQASAFTLLWLLIKRQKVAASLIAGSVALILTIGVVAFFRVAHSEQVALTALTQIEQEQAENRQLGLLAAPGVLKRATALARNFDCDGALEQLNLAVAMDGQLSAAWLAKGWLQLGRLEFDEALAAFDRAGPKRLGRRKKIEKPKAVEDVALKYRAWPTPWTRAQRLAFVADLNRFGRGATEWVQGALVEFFETQNRAGPDYALIVDELKILNPDGQALAVEPVTTPDGPTLVVRGEKLTLLLPLAGLPVTTLDLSGAVGADLAVLRTLPALTELRLLHWPRSAYPRLWPLTQVTHVVVAAADVPALQRELRNHMSTLPQVVGE